MKRSSFLLIVIVIFGFNSFIICKSPQSPEKLIIGKWINEKDVKIEFTKDKKVLFNEEVEGTYRFLEDETEDETLILIKYENTNMKYKLKFEDENTLLMTEKRVGGKEGPKELLKRVEE